MTIDIEQIERLIACMREKGVRSMKLPDGTQLELDEAPGTAAAAPLPDPTPADRERARLARREAERTILFAAVDGIPDPDELPAILAGVGRT